MCKEEETAVSPEKEEGEMSDFAQTRLQQLIEASSFLVGMEKEVPLQATK